MQKIFRVTRKIIGFTIISLTIMVDSAMALTVIETNLSPDGSDWTSNSNLNSISNVGAATCGGLDAQALQNCLNNTNFDIDLQANHNSEQANQQNNDDTNQNSEDDLQTISDNNVISSTSDNPIVTTQNTESKTTVSQSSNYRSEEASSIETYEIKSEQKVIYLDEAQSEAVVEKSQAKVESTLKTAPAKPIKKFIKKKPIPTPANTEFLEKQNEQEVLDIFKKISLEMNSATADIFTDWAKSNNPSYQADPWLIYLWFALAGFQSLFIVSYLVGNKLNLEKSKWRK